jgi:hypothetical protein
MRTQFQSFILEFSVLLLLGVTTAAAQSATLQPHETHPPSSSASAPLPDPRQLLDRSLASEKRTFDARENYLCQVHSETDELKSNGTLKKKQTEDDEEFFVNGHDVDRTLSRDGKPLDADQARKEDEHVQKEVKKYSDPAQRQKQESETQKQVEAILRVMQFKNERREIVDGRSTILFDLTGNPAADTRNVEERFMQAMSGAIRLDEASGQIIELNVRSDRDVKIGGGLVASLHKGFWFHLHQSPHSDGVWLVDQVEGSGDARAALFFHPYFHFRLTEGNCHLYGVSTTQTFSQPSPPQSK